MAIKIIKKASDPEVIKHCVCSDCGATLEYTPKDVTYKIFPDYSGGNDRYACFDCPNCNHHITSVK